MPSINMIAVRREEKRRQEQNVRKLLYGIVGELGLVVVVASVMGGRMLVAEARIHDLSDQLHKLQPRVTQIQLLETQTAAMAPKVETLDGAKSDTLFWYKNFYAVTDSLPPKTWLTSLGTGTGIGAVPPAAGAAPGAAGGTDPTLNIAGVALSQATVGETMLHMNQAPTLDHVDLAFVQQQKIGQATAVSFQMTVHLKPEAGAVPPGGVTADAKGTPNGTKS